MSQTLIGKKVIITGASRGLGRYIAQAMWRRGASLILAARSEAALLTLRDALLENRGAEQQIVLVTVDLSSPSATKIVASLARRVWGRVDVLVNNAGMIGPIGNVWENDLDEWRTAIEVNLLAPVALCRACIPLMRAGSKIINLSGGGATGPRPRFSAYASAKAALVRFSETLAQEISGLGIEVNCVAPGAMNTDMLQAVLRAGVEQAGEKAFEEARKQIKTGGTSPERAAELCAFLASAASDGITGRLISAVWDDWENLSAEKLKGTDIYTLRRIVP